MKRKIFMICMTMAFGVVLTGCHTEHEWQEADCTQPSTCIECGETQGEALGHTWQEADYFSPQICLTCGSEQGEPLQPSFEAHGLAANVRLGETYDYVTSCSADVSKTTVGKVTFSNYRIFEDTLLEGYEWRAVHMEIAFSDENAQNYGMKLGYAHEDYYDTETWDESYDEKGDNAKLYTIRYGGVDYTECKSIFSDSGYSGWVDGVNTLKCEVFAVVPVGYDGMVICLRNGGTERKAGESIYNVVDEGKISIFVRTYEAYLIPVLAERTVEAVYELAGKSAMPFGDISVYCVDEDENGRKKEATMTLWRTTDMETGTFSSVPDVVYEELYTIKDMYDYYEEYFDLIEKAMDGERVDAE